MDVKRCAKKSAFDSVPDLGPPYSDMGEGMEEEISPFSYICLPAGSNHIRMVMLLIQGGSGGSEEGRGKEN